MLPYCWEASQGRSVHCPFNDPMILSTGAWFLETRILEIIQETLEIWGEKRKSGR